MASTARRYYFIPSLNFYRLVLTGCRFYIKLCMHTEHFQIRSLHEKIMTSYTYGQNVQLQERACILKPRLCTCAVNNVLLFYFQRRIEVSCTSSPEDASSFYKRLGLDLLAPSSATSGQSQEVSVFFVSNTV